MKIIVCLFIMTLLLGGCQSPVPSQIQGNNALAHTLNTALTEHGVDLGEDTFMIRLADSASFNILVDPQGTTTYFITVAELDMHKYPGTPRSDLVWAYKADQKESIERAVERIKARRRP